jgi:ribosomal protein S18 acetylase RimI-like enzyme
MRAIEAWARDREATAVELGVHEFNAGAQNFYEKLGYGTMTRRLEKRLPASKLEPTR